MDQPKSSHPSQHNARPDGSLQAWLQLKQELEALHAQLEYVRLLLKLGVRKP